MSTAVTHIGAVVYDAAKRRFRGELHLADTRTVYVSASGYPSWDHRQISQALVSKVQTSLKGQRHAGA